MAGAIPLRTCAICCLGVPFEKGAKHDIFNRMSTIVEQAVTALQNLPADRRDELAHVIVDAAMPTIQYSDEQLEGIDAAITSADAGDFATDKEVEKAFARFRRV